jgi:hypothetical protein
LESSLYSLDRSDENKIFPKNYALNYKIILTNNLMDTIIIKNIIFENVPECIQISSPFLKIISHSKKKTKFLISAGEKLFIPCKLFIKENFEDSIGSIRVIWASTDLDKTEETKNLYNETVIELNRIVVKDILYKIEGQFINEKNNDILYKLKIKNLDNNSKIIHCEVMNENKDSITDIFRSELIAYGKTVIKDIILPQKELSYLLHFYDTNEMFEFKKNYIMDQRCNSIIKIEEYNLDNNIGDKKNNPNIEKQIFFTPEIISFN